MKVLGQIFATIITVTLSTLMNGFVFMKVWEWIVLPLFNANPLSLMQCIGILFIVSYLRYRKTENKEGKEYTEILTEAFIRVISTGIFYLLLGWVLSLFI